MPTIKTTLNDIFFRWIKIENERPPPKDPVFVMNRGGAVSVGIYGIPMQHINDKDKEKFLGFEIEISGTFVPLDYIYAWCPLRVPAIELEFMQELMQEFMREERVKHESR